MLIYNQLTK